MLYWKVVKAAFNQVISSGAIAVFYFLSLNAIAAESPPQHCRSVVALSPALSQVILDILGPAETRKVLVGAASYSPLPRDLKIPEVASVGRFNIERILSFRPDCVLESPGVFPSSSIDRLAGAMSALDRRSRIIQVPMDSLGDIADAYRNLGRLLGYADRGASLASDFETKLRALKGKLNGIRALIQVDDNPMIVVGGGKSFLAEAFEYLGVVNAYSAVREAYPRVSLESAVAANPDVIWILGESGDQKKDEQTLLAWKKRFPKIKAVREGRVRVIPSKELTLPTLALLQGLQQVVTDEPR